MFSPKHPKQKLEPYEGWISPGGEGYANIRVLWVPVKEYFGAGARRVSFTDPHAVAAVVPAHENNVKLSSKVKGRIYGDSIGF